MSRAKRAKRPAAKRARRVGTATASLAKADAAQRTMMIAKLEKLAPERPMQYDRAAQLLARAPRKPPRNAGTESGQQELERALAYVRALAPANPDEQRTRLTEKARRLAAKQPPAGIATPSDGEN